jgi:predicted nuclease of predicted toxin-antitoxin system
MKIILDECLPRRLLRDLPDHVATTVPRQGWTGLTDATLLKRVESEFDIFITMDANIIHQQNLHNLPICMIILHGPNSRYETLQPLLPQIRNVILIAAPGTVFHIGNNPRDGL